MSLISPGMVVPSGSKWCFTIVDGNGKIIPVPIESDSAHEAKSLMRQFVRETNEREQRLTIWHDGFEE